MAFTKSIQLISVIVCVLVLAKRNLSTSDARNTRLKLTRDDKVMISTLLPLTNATGHLLEDYVVAAEAIVYEIKNINKRQDILQNTSIGYEIIDNKGEDLHEIMAKAIDIVSKHRPRSICRSDMFCTKDFTTSMRPRISALVGPVTSATTVPVASLLGLYNIPVIGYSASSSLLSDKQRFKSFLRTIPSDNYQADAIASFVKYFEWNYVFFIGNDDEYGRDGLSAFKSAIRKRKVCTANDVNIAFQNSDVDNQVRKAVELVAKESRVQVVVLFMFEVQAAKVMEEAERQGLKNITWVLSDGANGARLLNYLERKELADGAIAVDFVSKRIPDFERHLRNITVKSSQGNPWMLQLLEDRLDCTTQSVTGGKRPCKENERFDFSLPSSRWAGVVNIINGVRAFAYGLEDLLKCKAWPVNGQDLYRSIKNVSFVGVMNETVAFDENGDLVTKAYVFRNYVYKRDNDSIERRLIASWSSTSPEEPDFNKKVMISWKGEVMPQATCSPICVPGQKKVGQSDCCWACHPCPKGEISNETSASNCTKCPEDHYANERQTECLRTGLEFVKASDPFSIVIIVISCLGLVAIAAMSLLFFKVRTTALIEDSDKTLLVLFLLACTLAFIFPIFQMTLYRNDSVCRFLSALLLYTVLLVGTALLAKTKTSDKHLRQLMTYFSVMKPVAQRYNLIMVMVLLFFQLLLFGIWYLTDTPAVHMIEQTKALHLRECNANWSAVRLIAYGFPILVLFLATIFAFKERNNRENHSEAKYVSFCTMSMCILLIAFFPTYRFVKGTTTSVVIATTSLVGAFAVTGCILLPKVYILVFRPQTNVHGHERSSEPTVSSAHTAGSHHGSSGNHYQGTGEKGPTADMEFASSQSSASSRVKDAVGKGVSVKL